MLEPTHQCNLSCQGCGRIQEYRETIGHALTLQECLQAVEDCGAPVVTITGGEPLLYPPVFELVQELVHRHKHIYLCTNAILLEKSLPRLPLSDHLTLSIHLDGLAATHDHLLGRPGLFNLAIKAIKAAVRSLGLQRARAQVEVVGRSAHTLTPIPVATRSRLAGKLAREEFPVLVEVVPPKGCDATKEVEGSQYLLEQGIDAVNIPDGAGATERQNAGNSVFDAGTMAMPSTSISHPGRHTGAVKMPQGTSPTRSRICCSTVA